MISVYSSTFHATQFIPVIAYFSYQRFYGPTEPTVPNVTLIQPLLSLHILHFIQFPQLLKLLLFLQFFFPQTQCVFYRHSDIQFLWLHTYNSAYTRLRQVPTVYSVPIFLQFLQLPQVTRVLTVTITTMVLVVTTATTCGGYYIQNNNLISVYSSTIL